MEVRCKRSRSPGTRNALSAANTHTGACEWYALAASAMQQQRTAAADERISWRPRGDIGGGVHRGSLGDLKLHITLAGHLELGAAASTKAVWWDLLLASLLMHLYLCLCNYFGF